MKSAAIRVGAAVERAREEVVTELAEDGEEEEESQRGLRFARTSRHNSIRVRVLCLIAGNFRNASETALAKFKTAARVRSLSHVLSHRSVDAPLSLVVRIGVPLTPRKRGYVAAVN